MILPEQLIANCRKMPERQEWLLSLPAMLEELTSRWSLRIDAPFDHANVTCSWVAAVLRGDGAPAVLKLGMPHMEGADEIHGLRFWNGDPTVQLQAARKASAVGARTAGASHGRSPRALTDALAAGGSEAKRAFEAMMTMKKIDIAAIEAARRG